MVDPQDIVGTSETEAPVVDGEIVEDVTPEVSADSDQSTVLLSLEELIKSHITSLDRLQEEKRKFAEL
ncbi:MAG: hypothetical protein KGJ07_06905, partial [Patescibacteria group bacterium]|nr:hypothetical protein [Patescibacteria group bacterium]